MGLQYLTNMRIVPILMLPLLTIIGEYHIEICIIEMKSFPCSDIRNFMQYPTNGAGLGSEAPFDFH